MNAPATAAAPSHHAADQRLVDGVLSGQRRPLAKAITLIESARSDHHRRAQHVLEGLLPHTGNSIRVGISGVPGAGKSTFIEALGLYLIDKGHRVAVLAVDPSSSLSGGSILGDKTRMERLSQQPMAFIRPSPTSGSLGGVAEKTREAMLVCEASGFDVIIVETVGVGQSETAVAGMVDVFSLLLLPNAGDELQAIKKGIVEIADVLVINKADIDQRAAHLARNHLKNVMSLLRPASPGWKPPIVTLSALQQEGIGDFWTEIERYRSAMSLSGAFADKRRRQSLAWMWELINRGLRHRFRDHPRVKRDLDHLSRDVEQGVATPAAVAERLLDYL